MCDHGSGALGNKLALTYLRISSLACLPLRAQLAIKSVVYTGRRHDKYYESPVSKARSSKLS